LQTSIPSSSRYLNTFSSPETFCHDCFRFVSITSRQMNKTSCHFASRDIANPLNFISNPCTKVCGIYAHQCFKEELHVSILSISTAFTAFPFAQSLKLMHHSKAYSSKIILNIIPSPYIEEYGYYKSLFTTDYLEPRYWHLELRG